MFTHYKLTLFVFCITVVASAGSLFWSEDSRLGRTLLQPVLVKSDSEGIETVELDYNNGTLELNIVTNKDLSCRQVIKLLAVDSFTVKNKTYVPMCQKLDANKLRISYEGTNTA